jgi:hypothetical protein
LSNPNRKANRVGRIPTLLPRGRSAAFRSGFGKRCQNRAFRGKKRRKETRRVNRGVRLRAEGLWVASVNE